MPGTLFARKPIGILLREMSATTGLRRALGPLQLTNLGVGAIIGAGIFVVIGLVARDKAGAATMLSFVIAGAACAFAALCYAEFASMVPVAGSAYTYAYATLGELLAWIIGWDLLLEYGVGAASVAHGWSHYFADFLKIFGLRVPPAVARAPFDYDPATGAFVATGTLLDLPALAITAALTAILVIGIRQSAAFNAVMVAIKLSVVLLIIAVGAFYVVPENWTPFAPYGYSGISFFGKTVLGQHGPGGEPLGVMAGAGIAFYAYIGFDSVSTHAEEARNPARDVPIGIVASLAVCTVLYIGVAAVLTGMVPYREINIDAPLGDAFSRVGLPWVHFIVSLGALTGITSVLMVLMLSQPRIMFAMARDGLLPQGFFGAVHPRFRTPWKSTLLTGAVVGLMSSLLPLRVLAELVNIGTLLAFTIVCAAVLIMRRRHPEIARPFRCPWVPVVPILGIGFCLLLMFSLPGENWLRLFVWLLLGLGVYFGYGRHHSVLARRRADQKN
ncbi:MAG TPA: amino acid permease [candidate division Zixibacteria bacterium]|nr:amino acid permease [candidate division Zixibacteria bacterium]